MKGNCNKAIFLDKKSAQTALNTLKVGKRKSNGRRRKVKHRPIRVYYCTNCKGWHLTSAEYYEGFDS